MNNFRWIPVVAALVLAAVVGGFAYNAGVASGIAQSGKMVAAPGAPYPYPYPYPYWHGGFFFAPFFFFIFALLAIRGLFWRGHHWHHGRCEYREAREHDPGSR